MRGKEKVLIQSVTEGNTGVVQRLAKLQLVSERTVHVLLACRTLDRLVTE
jgi:hypothetical protein